MNAEHKLILCEERTFIYKDSYNMCVTKLKGDNKISVFVAGNEVCAMIDTGSTISVISSDLFQKMEQTTKVDIKSMTDNLWLRMVQI